MSAASGSEPGGGGRRPLNGLAVASLVVALLLAGGLGLGIVLGVIALRQIERSGQRGRGAALAGIVLSGLWTVAIIAVAVTGTDTDVEDDDSAQVSTTTTGTPTTTTGTPTTTTGTPTTTPADLELPVNLLSVGTCVKDPGKVERNIKSLGATSCTKPHKGEVIAGFQSSAKKWPGLDGVRAEANRRCTPKLASVGQRTLRRRQVALVYLYPPEEHWSDDQRRILCIARTERPFRGKL